MTIPTKMVLGLPRLVHEPLTIVTANTIPALTFTPVNAASVKLFVNGVKYDSVRSPAVLSLSSKTIAWSAANAGFGLDSNDRVTVEYTTIEAAA